MEPSQRITDSGEGAAVTITYTLTDQQLADVHYRFRRRQRGRVVRLAVAGLAGATVTAAAPWLFPPAEQGAFEVVGCGLVLATVILAVLYPGQVRRAMLRNVRDNFALLQPVSLLFDDTGLQVPFDSSGTYVSWTMWQGHISEDATWFYLRLPGVRQPWPVPKAAMSQDAMGQFARLAGLRDRHVQAACCA